MHVSKSLGHTVDQIPFTCREGKLWSWVGLHVVTPDVLVTAKGTKIRCVPDDLQQSCY